MRYLSVCSGIEAASVAWHPLGWEPAAFCEIEAFPSAVLKERYPHVPNYGDFTRLTEPDHPIRSAGIDLIVGGTPCQAFSVAGLRRGLADPRGGLTLEFVRLAQALRPKWIVWENVPGVLSQDGGRAFGAFLGALGELGYGFAYRVLDAQYVRVDGYPHAVPQRRRRVFVVGCAGGDFARAAAVLLEPEGVRGDPPTRRATRQDAAPDASGGVDVAGCLQHRDSKGVDSDTKPGHILPVVPYDLFQITAPINRQNRDERSPCHTLARDNAAHAAVVQPLAFIGVFQQSSMEGKGTVGFSQEDLAKPVKTQSDGQMVVQPVLSFKPGQSEAAGGIFITEEYAPTLQAINNGSTAVPAVVIDAERQVCPTLTSRMQGSSGWAPYNEDAHLIPYRRDGVAAAWTQNSREEVRLIDGDGDITGAITSDAGSHMTTRVVQDAPRAPRAPRAVGIDTYNQAVTGDVTHTFRDPNGTMGDAVPAVAVGIDTYNLCETGDVNQTLKSPKGGVTESMGAVLQPVSVAQNQLGEVRVGEVMGTLNTNTNASVRNTPMALQAMAVRRLTPVECERLQGFPDGWTQIPWKGKAASECPDGPRYRALGNSMAVNVMRWIGRRIELVEKT